MGRHHIKKCSPNQTTAFHHHANPAGLYHIGDAIQTIRYPAAQDTDK